MAHLQVVNQIANYTFIISYYLFAYKSSAKLRVFPELSVVNKWTILGIIPAHIPICQYPKDCICTRYICNPEKAFDQTSR